MPAEADHRERKSFGSTAVADAIEAEVSLRRASHQTLNQARPSLGDRCVPVKAEQPCKRHAKPDRCREGFP
jgi:hypothetical protein